MQRDNKDTDATNSCPRKVQIKLFRNNFKNKEKPIGTMEHLKAFSVEKFTLDGRKFYTLTILFAKYLLRVLLMQLGLYSLYASPLVAVTELNFKKNLKNLSRNLI